jgi:hypothetical protein
LEKQKVIADQFVATDNSHTTPQEAKTSSTQTAQPTRSSTTSVVKPDKAKESPYVAGAPFRRKALTEDDLF